MNTERRQGSRCRLSQGTFALGYQIAWWSCPRGRCLYSINVFPTMSKRRKIAPSCLPCRGMVKDICRCVEADDHKDLRLFHQVLDLLITQTESKDVVVMPNDVIKRRETSIMEKAALRVCPNPL